MGSVAREMLTRTSVFRAFPRKEQTDAGENRSLKGAAGAPKGTPRVLDNPSKFR